MAKGYPDFFGFSMFPFNGPIIHYDASVNLTTSYQSVVDISGKGNVYVGRIYVDGQVGVNDSTLIVYLDGIYWDAYSLTNHRTNTRSRLDFNAPFYCEFFDMKSKTVTWAMRGGLSFGASLRVDIAKSAGAGVMSAVSEVYYQSIQT